MALVWRWQFCDSSLRSQTSPRGPSCHRQWTPVVQPLHRHAQEDTSEAGMASIPVSPLSGNRSREPLPSGGCALLLVIAKAGAPREIQWALYGIRDGEEGKLAKSTPFCSENGLFGDHGTEGESGHQATQPTRCCHLYYEPVTRQTGILRGKERAGLGISHGLKSCVITVWGC